MRNHRLIVLAAALVAILTFVPGCDLEEIADVKQSYKDFQSACNANNSAAAVGLLSSTTFPYYDRMVQNARTMKGNDILALPLVEQYTILGIRHELTREELRTADGKSYITMSIDRGYWGTGEVSATSEHMGRIKVRKTVATAPALDGYGKQTRFLYYFLKEDGVWKQDLSRGREAFTLVIEQFAGEMRISPEKAVFALIELDTGRQVPQKIWDPPF